MELSNLSLEELYKILEDLEESESNDLAMDGSGELGAIISSAYHSKRQNIESEFERRGIDLYDRYQDDTDYNDQDEHWLPEEIDQAY